MQNGGVGPGENTNNVDHCRKLRRSRRIRRPLLVFSDSSTACSLVVSILPDSLHNPMLFLLWAVLPSYTYVNCTYWPDIIGFVFDLPFRCQTARPHWLSLSRNGDRSVSSRALSSLSHIHGLHWDNKKGFFHPLKVHHHPPFNTMVFPFSKLPLELALEVLQLAASTGWSANDRSQPRIYHTATTLCLVSSNFRQVAMRHLLHTVILNSHESVNLFIQTLQQQKSFATKRSRLSVDYPRFIRHIWTSECRPPVTDAPECHFIDYRLFYDIFSKVETLGFDFHALHLLYDALEVEREGYLRRWHCGRVTLGGSLPRWNGLTSTSSGAAFLREITHLTIWCPTYDGASSFPSGRVPHWVASVPFKHMPNLTHFAFTLVGTSGSATTPVLVYKLPYSSDLKGGATKFLEWASSSDPFAFGFVVHLDVNRPMTGSIPDEGWELAYYRGENDIWRAPGSIVPQQAIVSSKWHGNGKRPGWVYGVKPSSPPAFKHSPNCTNISS